MVETHGYVYNKLEISKQSLYKNLDYLQLPPANINDKLSNEIWYGGASVQMHF